MARAVPKTVSPTDTVQPLDHGSGGFVLSAPTRAHEHRGPLKVHAVPVDTGRAMVAITWDPPARPLRPGRDQASGYLAGGEKPAGPDDQAGELLREAVLIGKAGSAIELKREPRLAAGQLPLCGGARQGSARARPGSARHGSGSRSRRLRPACWRGTSARPCSSGSCGLDGGRCAGAGQKVVDRLLGLGCAEVDDATPRLEDGVDPLRSAPRAGRA